MNKPHKKSYFWFHCIIFLERHLFPMHGIASSPLHMEIWSLISADLVNTFQDLPVCMDSECLSIRSQRVRKMPQLIRTDATEAPSPVRESTIIRVLERNSPGDQHYAAQDEIFRLEDCSRREYRATSCVDGLTCL